MWINATENASFWMQVLTNLKARGVEDILISCTDNLTGFSQAIEVLFIQQILKKVLTVLLENIQKANPFFLMIKQN